MILSVTFSKPVKNICEILDKEYSRIKIKLTASSASDDKKYFAEFYTDKQVFHKKLSENELKDFISEHAGTTFKNVVQRTESEEITILANKKGKISTLKKKINASGVVAAAEPSRQGCSASGTADDPTVNKVNRDAPHNLILKPAQKTKNYILREGCPVPFMVLLGIMTPGGKVIQAKYDKFRQINRFLELVNDVLPEVLRLKETDENKEISVVDFGSGKSYLTFAIQYYLTEIKQLPCKVFGLDLKKDVIDYCNSLTEKLQLKNLSFAVGNISDFSEDKNPDIIATLHACDTATDFALDYAVKHQAKAVLSVPCCQHEINLQLKKSSVADDSPLKPLLKYGIVKERLSALITDTVRAELLEQCGYEVQILEFIDAENTPKNLMIRAVKKSVPNTDGQMKIPAILDELKVQQTLKALLTKK